MSATQDLEQRIADHYAAEAPTRAPDWILDRVVASVDTTPQRRAGLGGWWRTPTTPSTLAKPGAIAAALAAVGLGGLALLWGPVMGPTPSPSPAVSAGPSISGGMWPQSSLDEVRQAQELADAGDPRYTWQVDPFLDEPTFLGQNHPGRAEIFGRFLEEKLGWEAFLWHEAFAHRDNAPGDVIYVRCAPGRANPLYPADSDGCAPTLDELRYETVRINVARPVRQDSKGIWVVTGWEMLEPFEQAVPPSDTEIGELADAFVQARIDGNGAEGFIDFPEYDELANELVAREVPLLYATSTGAAYERSELEVVDGPVWPEGRMQVELKLFAENGATQVEQVFSVGRDETGRLRLLYDFRPMRSTTSALGAPSLLRVPATTENGNAVPVEFGFLGGAVTYRAAYPFEPSQDGFRDRDRLAIDGSLPDDDAPRRVLILLADPRPIGPGCVEGPVPADAEALAQSLLSDPDLEATAPVAVTLGGIPALQMDAVLAPGATFCSWSEPETGMSWSSPLLRNAPFHFGADRARLILVDLPRGSQARVLAIVTIADEDSFETVLGSAAPIVDSIEFHAP